MVERRGPQVLRSSDPRSEIGNADTGQVRGGATGSGGLHCTERISHSSEAGSGSIPGGNARSAAMSPKPYPGLRPFEEGDTDFFFGRDRQISDLINRLRTQRFVGVVGFSGSGKSSL